MVIVLLAIILATCLGISLAHSEPSWKDTGVLAKMTFWCVFWFNMAWVLFFAIIVYSSYDTYLDQRAFYDATIEQYATAVTMYHDYAEIDVESAAWTDLKYKGYQDNIAELIKSLRNRIITYNEDFIKKNKMHNNPWFSWIIIGMDKDMKLLKMKTANQ